MDGLATCANCGIQASPALRRVAPRLFEDHHPFGRHHMPEVTVVLCANCHAMHSAGQLDDGVELRPTPTVLERLVAITGALGSHLRVLSDALLNWSDRGTKLINGLDHDYPDWRDRPWAK